MPNHGSNAIFAYLGAKSHTFTVPSSLADASRFPSGLNATPKTVLVCVFNVNVS